MRPPVRRLLPLAAALAITAYGAVLRLDALVAKYGTVDRPGWARVLTHSVAPIGASLRPFALGWPPIDPPYVGGDPINYLKYGREMRSFYQGHIREPIFLALTRVFLWLLSNQDIAVSFASLAGSTLAIVGTYLLGAQLASPAAGLLAALVMAVERENITWAPDGWRDDTFTAAVVFAAWALVRFRANRSMRNAVLVGVTGAVACLTRITAISFVLPGMLLVLVSARRSEWRTALRPTAVAVLTLLALVTPYLVSCAIELRDPLIAINYHTGYYRFSEGLPSASAMSAPTYVREKLTRAPLATADTAMMGVFVQPFITKWTGLDGIVRGLALILSWSAIAGMLMLAFVPAGRLLLAILLASLIPYALTWNIGGGSEWRFTMHTYPFYLVAAGFALTRVGAQVRQLARARALPSRPAMRIGVARVAGVGLVSGVAWGLYLAMPWLAARETLARGEDLTVGAGPRDRAFFHRDWSSPHTEGLATVRVSLADRAIIWLPLPSVRAYDVVLRFDPVSPALQHRVSVLLNQQFIAQVGLGYDAQRVGSYRIQLPSQFVRAGANELALVPDAMVPRIAAGTRFGWVQAGDRLGLRLWHVRLLGGRVR